jgi:hypothetical protein
MINNTPKGLFHFFGVTIITLYFSSDDNLINHINPLNHSSGNLKSHQSYNPLNHGSDNIELIIRSATVYPGNNSIDSAVIQLR